MNKLSMQEKKKLQRRLPLWEDAYKVASSENKKQLKVKIDNARKILGLTEMPETKEEKNSIKDRKKKPYVQKGSEKRNNLLFDIEKILYMKNIQKLKDKEICEILKINSASYSKRKNKYLKANYQLKQSLILTPSVYCNIKNNTNMTDLSISKMYFEENNLNHPFISLAKMKSKYIDHKLMIKSDLYISYNLRQYLKKLIKEINENGLVLKKSDKENKNLIERYCYYYYGIKNPMLLTPEIYINEKNYYKRTDVEILEKYEGCSENSITRMKENYIEVVWVENI